MIASGQRVEHRKTRKLGTAITDEQDDPYGYGRRVVTVKWDTGRTSGVYAENVKAI